MSKNIEENYKEEYEQALKRRNKDYADSYVQGLKDAFKGLTYTLL